MNLKFYWPIKPYVITQKWGNPSTAYSTHFNDPNFKRHNGIDANVGRLGDVAYQTQFAVYCPAEGFRVESVSYEANGGGNQISCLDRPHPGRRQDMLRPPLALPRKEENYQPKLGELLMIGDNTGFSTGPHTHMGLYRVDGSGYKLDSNDATGSIDPSLFFAEEYAIAKASVPLLISNGMRLAKYYLTANRQCYAF